MMPSSPPSSWGWCRPRLAVVVMVAFDGLGGIVGQAYCYVVAGGIKPCDIALQLRRTPNVDEAKAMTRCGCGSIQDVCPCRRQQSVELDD